MATSTSNDVSSLASKFRGCLLGSHIGDCFGEPFGFGTCFASDVFALKSIVRTYIEEILKDSSKGGVIQAQPYTDDTAMTFSLAESLIANNGFNPTDMAKRFVDEFFNQPRRGYGFNVVDVFKVLKETNFVDVFEPARLQFRGTGSYGNGAAMRIAPVALYYYNDEETLKKIAKESSLITHTHQNGYNGAILQSLAIHQALRADSSKLINPADFANCLLQKMETIEEPMEDVGSLDRKQPYCNSLKIIKELFEKGTPNLSPASVAELLGNKVIAHKSVPAAIYSFLRGTQPLEDFENDSPFVRAIYFAISLGGDTDTIGAMAGSISGAYYGEDSIPDSFFPRCESIDRSLKLANELFSKHMFKED